MIKKQQSLDTWIKHPQPKPTSTSRPSSSLARLPLPYAPSPGRTKEPHTRTQPRPTPMSRPHPTRVHHRPPATNTKETFKWMRGELLGSGSYGRVYLAMNVATGELMAVKQVEIFPGDHKQDALKFLAFESQTLKDLDHPNIVQYLGYEESSEALSVFLEYVPGGTISSLLHIHGAFREEVTKSFTKQILQGLEYLHAHKIIHRDLKPDNILVEPQGICKITDFGISKRVEDINSAKAHTLLKGTAHYMAPEILGSEENKYDGKIDIWSVGCMVMEMWTGEKPWGKELFIQIMYKLQELRSPPPLPSELRKELSPEAKNFREACFHINPVERPASSELKEHPYLVLSCDWSFDGTQVSHPSRGKYAKNKQSFNKNGDTLRSFTTGLEHYDSNSTFRADEIPKGDIHVIKVPPRGPSPPIVYIEPPLPRDPIRQQIPSPTDPEPDKAPSESSTTSYGRRPRRKYVVNNPNPEGDTIESSFRYYPPELPAVSTPRGKESPYSSRLDASSKYNLNYSPKQSGSPRARSPSSTHSGVNPTGNKTPYLVSEETSRHAQKTVLTSSDSFEDNRTWKKPPATFRHRANSSSSSASSYTKSEQISPSRGQRTRDRLQSASPVMPIPPPPTVPPPRPPLSTQTSAAPLQMRTLQPSPMKSRPNIQPRCDTSQRKVEMLEASVQNRPGADVIVRHLGDWFRNHDLDDPVVVPAVSVDDLTVNSDINEGGENLLISYSNPVNRANDQRYSAYVARNRGSIIQSNTRGLAPTKSIRKIAEERQSTGHPRRRSLWDFKMEELKTPAPSSQS